MGKKAYKKQNATAPKPTWNNITDIDQAAMEGAMAEGLVAIQECHDYDLEKVSRKGNLVTQTKRGIKRPHKTIEVNDNDNKTPPTTPKQKPLTITPSKSGSSTQNDIISDDTTDTPTQWSAFGLPADIQNALIEQQFHEPTPIQALTLPAAIFGRRDIIGAAETGSGKTLAFGLPILAGILNSKQDEARGETRPLYALILTPTRELAMQIKAHLTSACKFLNGAINVAVLVGGMAAVKQERILARSPEIVVATPGRLWELISQGNRHLSQVEFIRYLVIDETDRMLEKGHFEELYDLLEKLNKDETIRNKRQNFVFSATLTLVHDLPSYLSKKFNRPKKMSPEVKLKKIIDILGISNPKIVDLSGNQDGGGMSRTLTESRINCSIDEKDYYVYYFLKKYPGRTLIFCNSIGCVRRLASLLSVLQCKVLPLHAGMQQKQRLKNLERFRDDSSGILIATDVAARGLDIPAVEHVLHYQTPRTTEGYVHRSGRTARASRRGLTVLIIEPSELQNYVKLCKTLDRAKDIPIFPVEESYLSAIKDRVNLARDIDKLNLNVRKENSEKGWLQKAAEQMDIIVDDLHRRGVDSDDEDLSQTRLKRVSDLKRKQLAAMLAKPVFPRGFSGKYILDSGTECFEDLRPRAEDKVAVDMVDQSGEDVGSKVRKAIPLYKPNRNKRTRK